MTMTEHKESTLRKAAILIRSLDDRTASSLLAQLPPSQAAQVREIARYLDDVDPIEQQQVLNDFLGSDRPRTVVDDGGVELDVNLAHEPQEIVADTRSRPVVFGGESLLHDSDVAELSRLLEHEQPQTIALVLAHLTSHRASDVLMHLGVELRAEVVRRLVELDEAHPEALAAVQRNLESRLQSRLEGQRRQAAGMATMRQILHASGPLTEHELLSSIARHDAELATRLGRAPQVAPAAPPPSEAPREIDFDELIEWTDVELAEVVADCDPQVMRLALAGATLLFAERIYRLLGGRAAKKLRRSIEQLGAVRMSDVAAAQREVCQIAAEQWSLAEGAA
jgi:flagellar motor switch protein FliG